MYKFNQLLTYQLTNNVYVGQSPYGLFDQDEIITELKNCGVTVIVSLLEYDEMHYDISRYLHNFKHIALPTQKGEVPFLDIIKYILELIDTDEIIYIHSMDGAGRANVVAATYLHREYGLKGEDLLLKLRDTMDGKIGLMWGRMSQKQREYILKIGEE